MATESKPVAPTAPAPPVALGPSHAERHAAHRGALSLVDQAHDRVVAEASARVADSENAKVAARAKLEAQHFAELEASIVAFQRKAMAKLKPLCAAFCVDASRAQARAIRDAILELAPECVHVTGVELSRELGFGFGAALIEAQPALLGPLANPESWNSTAAGSLEVIAAAMRAVRSAGDGELWQVLVSLETGIQRSSCLCNSVQNPARRWEILTTGGSKRSIANALAEIDAEEAAERGVRAIGTKRQLATLDALSPPITARSSSSESDLLPRTPLDPLGP